MYLWYEADAEATRLRENDARTRNWSRWGPYLAERQWATVREDYSANGDVWNSFPHEHARSRAYRWGEDGLLGVTDRQCRLCFALALWNEADPILKERLFGLTGPQGNHGEDVKECYYYLDSTPTHSYLKGLYRYPQRAFPYAELVEQNRRRGKHELEYELYDTGVFDDGRYFDVLAEYAKASPNDLLIKITLSNRGPAPARLQVLPQLWFRNTWIWGCAHEGCSQKPRIELAEDGLRTQHEALERFRLFAEPAAGAAAPEWLLTENESNSPQLWGVESHTTFFKDAFHEFVIHGRREALSPKRYGTKAAAHYRLEIPAGESRVLRLRLCSENEAPEQPLGPEFEHTFAVRQREADDFYQQVIPQNLSPEEQRVSREGYAGLLWTKQFYHYVVEDWLGGDPWVPPPPSERKQGRNADWPHLFNRDILSLPDKWEYPWYAAWDSAFHMIPFARIDPGFAKSQLELFLREWYMHPSGQIPAYEFNFSDVNPPVHAWACWRVYKMTGPPGGRDVAFLAAVFQKLLVNFTWWVNRKDPRQKHLFSGGFLGLDNIGVFDRSQPLPTGGHLEQADGTAWMAFYCSTMLAMALELAQVQTLDRAAEDIASKFFEHFVHITEAMNCLGESGLWDEEDGFYYDQIYSAGRATPLKLRSMVGLIPLFAGEVLEAPVLQHLHGFRRRFDWFRKYREPLARHIMFRETNHGEYRRGLYLLAIPSADRLRRVLKYMLDENEFLSPYGVRSLSKIYADQPFELDCHGQRFTVRYTPGESDTGMFGGNSNWRGPVWFPVNFLLIEALQRYHYFYGDDFQVECPTGSGQFMNLRQVALEIARRLSRLFLPGSDGALPCHGGQALYRDDPHFRGQPLFYEYFHGDTGRGLGASHQTGWTALVVRCLELLAHDRGG